MQRDVAANIQQIWSNLRQDKEALFELRQLFFAVIIAAVLVYALYVVQVQGKEKERNKNLRLKTELAGNNSVAELDSLIVSELQKLKKKKQDLTENVDLLRFKEKILREQYAGDGNSESFANVIFTLLPLSPVDIENGFVQMSVLETRSFDFFDVNPISLKGDIDYSDFLYYLQYLEGRPEVGMIGDIKLEIIPPESMTDSIKVHFDVVLGRVQLHR